ncbi:MAG: LPS assembly protein LptD [Thermodesulfobacteriota bacterium]
MHVKITDSFRLRPAAALALAALLLLGLARPAAAAEDPLAQRMRQGADWAISADSLAAQHDADILEARGNVLLTQAGNSIKADFARYYQSTGWVYLKGGVEVLWQGDRLAAQEAEFDLRNMVGWLKRGSIFVAGPHLYFTGEHIEKLAGDSYAFENAKVTACDDSPPAWSLHMERGEITLDGYAVLHSSTVSVLDQAVAYTPLLVLPAKVSRQSGLLTPEYGVSSRLGAYFTQPYYQVIDDSSDFTVSESVMSKRGLMHGLEYRSAPDLGGKGLWRVDWMSDSQVATTEADEGSALGNDGLVRSNRVRWWWRSKYDGRLADPRWKLKLDLDWVSDQNYLREFKNGRQGFDKSQEEFLIRFKRGLEQRDDLLRTSTALAHRDFDAYTLAVRSDWTQNLAHTGGNRPRTDDPSVQRLPGVDAYVFKDRLFSGPLEWSLDSGLANFWSMAGDKGGRFDVRPQLSLPLANEYGGLVATAGVRQTMYAVEQWGVGNATRLEHDGSITDRTLPELHAAAFTGASKVFDLGADLPALNAENAGQSRWTKLKHAVQPRLEYDWTSFAEQSGKPQFDEIDRILPRNELTYSLTNLLDRRRESITLIPDGENATRPEYSADYLEFFRLRLEQSYDVREAGRRSGRSAYPRRPFGDVVAETAVSPASYLSLVQRTQFSPYLGKVTEHEHMLRSEIPDFGRALVGLDFRDEVDEYKRQARERMRILHLGMDLYISRRWSAGFEYYSDMVTDTDLEKTLRLIYHHQCFTLTLHYMQTPFEDRIEARVDLLGMSF